ncbi:hypothetical protein SH661x_000845 [Planctomicrobium sp. SH661]|uniref:hypothetical protein n=1 Tax=Planctomicrobium sp. SH661 TaxID=3448124 RepID=UPI003F5B11CA
MLRIRACLKSCLIAGGIFTATATTASAQTFENAGVVRVSDSTAAVPSATQNCPNGNCPNGSSGDSNCPPGGYGYGYGSGHGDGYRFSPPVKRPIYRSPVSYTKGFPDAWTGQAAYGQQYGYRAPTVYMPTDTTQLGYYYQVVPYWQPKPGAIPPPPVPSQWHTTVGMLPGYGHHPAGVIYGTAPTAVPHTPTPPPWGGQGLPPEPTPANTNVQSVQPTRAESSAQGLERTSSSPALLPIE